MKMKKILWCVMFIIATPAVQAQNLPACDSLFYDCCAFNLSGNGTLTLTAYNQSSVLFDYPSFILLDANGDTVAYEVVNYFGISAGPQDHVMIVSGSIPLPFFGTLQLYTGFGSSLSCSWPVLIPDTLATGITTPQQPEGIALTGSNVVHDFLEFECIGSGIMARPLQYTVTGITGQTVLSGELRLTSGTKVQIPVAGLGAGLYHLVFRSGTEQISKKFVRY